MRDAFHQFVQSIRQLHFFSDEHHFTPIAGAIIVLTQVWIAFSPAFANGGERSMRLFLAAAAASMAMLGPGAWSVDARRFGRKVFEIGEPRRSRS